MAATADGAVDVLSVGDMGNFKEETSIFIGVKDILQALAFIFEKFPQFYLIHRIILITTFRDGVITMPSVIADVERCGFERTPTTSLANKVVEVCEGGIGLYLEFDGEVFNFGTDSCNGVEHING